MSGELTMRNRTRTVLLAGLAIAACLGGGCGGGDDGSSSATARYSVPTAELDGELACKGGKAQLNGEKKYDPVLLVPGTTTREQDWGRNYWRALPDRGLEVCWVQLPEVFGDIQSSAEYIARAIEVMHEATGEPIDVVGHSQGGVSSRWAIRWFPAGAFVDDEIGLAAPHHGGVVADSDISRGRAPEFEWQFRTDASFLRALNRGDESPRSADYTSIYSKTDELLQSVATPRIDGGTNILLQDLCPGRRVTHQAIVTDAVAYSLVIDALSHAGSADPDRAGVDCAADRLPGAADAPPEDSKGVDFHLSDHEPPLKPYAGG
jgi:triacylglycerol lipase